MSHSVPSESSATDTTFLVGTDLVQFDRHELPIYQTPESKWAEACFDEAPYGAPLDRLFGEPGDLHIDGSRSPTNSRPASRRCRATIRWSFWECSPTG